MSKAPQKIKAKVVGPLSVDGVAPGGYIEVSPLFVNLRQLLDAGHISLSKEALKQLEDYEGPGALSPSVDGPKAAPESVD